MPNMTRTTASAVGTAAFVGLPNTGGRTREVVIVEMDSMNTSMTNLVDVVFPRDQNGNLDTGDYNEDLLFLAIERARDERDRYVNGDRDALNHDPKTSPVKFTDGEENVYIGVIAAAHANEATVDIDLAIGSAIGSTSGYSLPDEGELP